MQNLQIGRYNVLSCYNKVRVVIVIDPLDLFETMDLLVARKFPAEYLPSRFVVIFFFNLIMKKYLDNIFQCMSIEYH